MLLGGDAYMKIGKQPNMVRGNVISCANFKQCPICY